MHQRWLEAKANFAVEGIEFTDEEQAMFAHMIEQGMDEDQSAKYMAEYLAGKVAPPNHDPVTDCIRDALGGRGQEKGDEKPEVTRQWLTPDTKDRGRTR